MIEKKYKSFHYYLLKVLKEKNSKSTVPCTDLFHPNQQ